MGGKEDLCKGGNNDQKQLRLDEDRSQPTANIHDTNTSSPSALPPAPYCFLWIYEGAWVEAMPSLHLLRFPLSITSTRMAASTTRGDPGFSFALFWFRLVTQAEKKKVISVKLLFCSVRKSLQGDQKPRCGGLLLCFSFFIAAFGFLSNGGEGGVWRLALSVFDDSQSCRSGFIAVAWRSSFGGLRGVFSGRRE